MAHVARFGIGVVETERLAQVVRGVPAGGSGQILAQQRAVVRVGLVFDDDFGPLPGGEASQIGHALLGDDDVHVVLCVVGV